METLPARGASDSRALRAEGALLLGLAACVALGVLYFLGRLDYLAFHSVVELFVASVAFAIFTVAWHTKKIADDDYLLTLGIAMFFVGGLTILHALTYKGMSVLPWAATTTGSQVWLLLRAAMAAGFIIGPHYIGRRLHRPGLLVLGFAAVLGPATLAVATHAFPVTFVDGTGLTHFKVYTEWVIIAGFAAGAWLLWRKRDRLKDPVFRDLMAAIVFAAAAEIPFSFYTSLYDGFNVLGHLLHVVSFFFVYRALVASSLEDPISMLFHELSRREEALVEQNRLSEGLNRIGASMNSSLAVDSIMRSAVTEAAKLTGADAAALSMQGGDGKFRVHYSHGYPESATSVPFGRDEAPHAYLAVENREPVVIADARTDTRAGRTADKLGLRSLLSVPLITRGEPTGVLSFHWKTKALGTEAESLRRFATKLSSSVSLALANAHLFENEHRVAETLQSAISAPPESMSGVAVGSVYRPAPGVGRIGGDFYDVFALSDGRVAFLLGDVSGKGLEAATITALARSTIRAVAYRTPEPAAVLAASNDALGRQLSDSEFVTIAYGVLDPATLHVSIGLAGHPEPIVCGRPDIAPADDQRNPPLGVPSDTPFAEWSFALEPNDTLILYSDGICEARRGTTLFGIERIRALLEPCAGADPQDVADQLMVAAEAFCDGLFRDDVAILALKPSGRPV